MNSKNVLIKSANWIVSSGISNFIEKNTEFVVSGEIADLKKRYGSHTQKLEHGELKLNLDALDVKDIWIEDSSLNVVVKASGTAALDVFSTQSK